MQSFNRSNPSLIGDSLTLSEPACFITRADILLRVQILFYTGGYFITRAENDMT